MPYTTYTVQVINFLCNMRGYNPICLAAATVAFIGECAFYIVAMAHNGEYDLITCSALLCAVLMCALNMLHCYSTAFHEASIPTSNNTDIEDTHLAGVSYLRACGFDAFAKAQERAAVEAGRRGVDKATSLKTFKEDSINAVLTETLTLHLLPGLIPSGVAAVVSAYRNYMRGEHLLCGLAIITVYSRLVTMAMLVEVAFFLRLSQVWSMFEVRRVEADIRTVAPAMIHRITARFKALLHEAHAIGNLSHQTLVFYSLLLVNLVQMMSAIYIANLDTDEGETITEVPAWSFAAVIQPTVTLLTHIFAYGNLNLAIERDLDQDIVEMNVSEPARERMRVDSISNPLLCRFASRTQRRTSRTGCFSRYKARLQAMRTSQGLLREWREFTQHSPFADTVFVADGVSRASRRPRVQPAAERYPLCRYGSQDDVQLRHRGNDLVSLYYVDHG